MGLLFSFHPDSKVPGVLGPERNRLLEAALKVFASHDYARASLRRIAAEAKVTAAMVNYYFGGKQQLFAAVVDASFKHLQQLVASRTAATLPFRARLNGFIEAHEIFATGFTDAAELMVRAAFRPSDHAHRTHAERYQPLRVLAREILATAVAQGEVRLAAQFDVQRASDHLLAQVEMLVIQRVQLRRFPDAESPKFTTEEVIILFLHGIAEAQTRDASLLPSPQHQKG
jgi:AcrR family transcriptional regulator